MASPRLPSPVVARHYQLPELLHDIRLLDLLELCGTTVKTSQLLRLSQPTISRRYRVLAKDFGLVRNRTQRWGCVYGSSSTMRLLRLGCRDHRLAAGVSRIGSDLLHQPLLAGCPWLLPTPQRYRPAANWLELVRQGVLDGALISGLELDGAEGVTTQGLELLPLSPLSLALACGTEGPASEVLVPDRRVAPGLRRLLQELGLKLRTGGTSLQSPDDWIHRIQGRALALVVADQGADTWAGLPCRPLPTRPCSPVWLALPADWQEHPGLRRTAEELG